MATEQEQIKVYIPADEAQKFKAIAKADERSITSILRRLIRNFIAEHEGRNEA